MVDFTVAIPTYNGEKRLPDVLERLRSQTDTEHFPWEVIVVDNNSSDGTAQVVREYQARWPTTSTLKYSFEAQQGAACARQRAVEEASGAFIGFLDDDNLPVENWVAAAYAFGQAHPQVGAYGSQIYPQFETEPPAYFKKVACFFAIFERGSYASCYEPYTKMLPPGAGLVVRKQAWRENVPKRLVLNHAGKEAGLASEDLEAVLHIQKAGWEIWYNPDMCIYHKIPPSRLERDYLISLVRCVGLSRHHLRMLRMEPWQRPLATPIYLINDLRKLTLHIIKHRGKVNHDAIAACERELLRSSLVSPFFLWSKRYRNLKTVRKFERETKVHLSSKVENLLDLPTAQPSSSQEGSRL